MTTTSDLNNGSPTDADKFAGMDDAEFAREFGLTVEDGAEAEKPEPTDTSKDEPAAETAAKEPKAEEKESKAEEKEEAEPEAEKAEEKPDETKKPITNFKVFDDEGEIEVPELELEFKADGKVRKLPLDKVVRLAQSGYYNEQLVKEMDQFKAENPQLRDENESLRLALEDQKALNMRLLQDDDYLLQVREQVKAETSPEKRAARAEDRVRHLEQQGAQRVLQAEAQQFTLQQVQPRLEALLKEYPSITQEELYGKFVIVTNPLMQRGSIPKANWAKAVDAIERDLGPWMAQLHEHRQASVKERDTKVTKAKEEAAQAKRTLAKALKPAAGASKPDAAPTRKAPSSVDEAADQIIADITAGLR